MNQPRPHSVLAFVGALSLGLGLLGAGAFALGLKRGFSTRDDPSSLEALVARTARRLAVPSHSKELRAPPPTPALLQEARAHWASHCASCHGEDGAGQTAIGQRLYPRAPDMRAASTQEQTDGELYFVIKNGVRLTGMPAWGEPGDQDPESWALVAFIRTLPKLTPDELAEVRANLPRTPHQLREELEEQEFLRGAPSLAPPTTKPPEHRHE